MTHTIEISGSTVTKRFTSWSRDEPTREWTALTLLSKAVPDLVPTPLTRSTTVITMTRTPGEPLDGSLTSTQLTAVSNALGTLWTVPPEGLAQTDLAAVLSRTHTGLAVLRETDGVIAEAATAWLDNPPRDLTDVPDPVVAHGDPNLSNYLWDGSRVRVIDFEDAGLGDRTVELANLVEHLSWRATDPTTLVRRFAPEPERYQAARQLWAGFWLMLIGPGGPSAHRNPPGTAEAQARRVVRLVAG